MSPKNVIIYFTGAVLATEIIIKHGEDSPHIPHEQYTTDNSGMGINAYHISNMQTPTGPTMPTFTRLLTKDLH